MNQVESDELDDRLRRAVGGLEGFDLAPDELRSAVLEVVSRRRRDAPTAAALELAPPCLADFCLAHACRRSPPLERAWVLVVERYSRELLATARECGDGAPEEVVSAFFGDLWIVRSRGRSLLDTYMGLGPLRAWLVLVFRRQLVRAARRGPAFAPLLDGQASPTPAAEEELLREEFLATVRPMLQRTLASLSTRDRELLVARVLRSERGIDTARRFGVSPAYVSQRFKELVRELRARLLPPLSLKGFDAEEGL